MQIRDVITISKMKKPSSKKVARIISHCSGPIRLQKKKKGEDGETDEESTGDETIEGHMVQYGACRYKLPIQFIQ